MNARDLNKRSATDWARIDQMTDEEIDTSDIPPLDDDFFARAKWRMPHTNERSPGRLKELGGIESLVLAGRFSSAKRLGTLLVFLREHLAPSRTHDGIYAQLATNGFEETELQKIIELHLVEMRSREFEKVDSPGVQDKIRWCQLTPLGHTVLECIDDQPE